MNPNQDEHPRGKTETELLQLSRGQARVSALILNGYQLQLLNLLRPDVRYNNERKSNPALRGVNLVVAAFLFVVLPLLEFVLLLRHSCVQAGVARLRSEFHMA